MIYQHKVLQKQGISNYQIQKLIKEKKLYFIEAGIYSTEEKINYLEYIMKKHPNVVFTLTTACYFYGLTKRKEDRYIVATKQKDRKIKDEKVKQIFMKDNLYIIGKCNIKYKNIDIAIYDLERILIEIVRNKTSIDFEMYKEIIGNYKKISKLINKKKLESYLINFKNEKIKLRINKEVFNSGDY